MGTDKLLSSRSWRRRAQRCSTPDKRWRWWVVGGGGGWAGRYFSTWAPAWHVDKCNLCRSPPQASGMRGSFCRSRPLSTSTAWRPARAAQPVHLQPRSRTRHPHLRVSGCTASLKNKWVQALKRAPTENIISRDAR